METAMNYKANTYHFRQDSSFLYYFGLNQPDLFGIIDIDSGEDFIFGNDIDMEDIIWMGNLPSIADRAGLVGVTKTFPLANLETLLQHPENKKRTIHFLNPYRGETIIQLQTLLDKNPMQLKENSSKELAIAIVQMRSIKEDQEIEEIEKVVDVAGIMHTTAMRMAMPGIIEREISGIIEGIALSKGVGVSFPIIATMHGEILHNHNHGNILKKNDLLIIDAGAESELGYASDITRTSPVGGEFTPQQKDIYELVLAANLAAIEMTKPGICYKDVHLKAATVIAEGLKAIGLMKGNVQEAVQQGAHALFFPHGLGHMMGLDVHDMENIGENYVGYDNTTTRSNQFGLAYLRLGKKLETGNVITNEPGIYFIPALIDLWQAEKKFAEFINYDALKTYRNFGGIRLEDDLLITKTGSRVLGKPIPKTVNEVEAIVGK
jgi:Xaa-Pro aminopeptidase